jgi:phosphoglycolate phosphatase
MLDDPVYPGTNELLSLLKLEHRCNHYLATAKAWPYAKTILEHHGLSSHFSGIYGSELDGTRSKKSLLIKWILDNHPEINIKKCFMIGDRLHDVEAAKSHGIPTIGVTYGYGGYEELSKAGATHIVGSVSELRSLLLSLTN